MFTLDELRSAADLVGKSVPQTPQIHWPLLSARAGLEVWVKHENHLPTGAFKVRGGVTFIDWLIRTDPACPGIITATRGNHGQSQARAATARGLRAVVYVPFGNSSEKNAAMQAYGAELVAFGSDFDEAKTEARRMAAAEGLAVVPPFDRELVRGVATYGLELLSAQPDIHTVYVPIGCGSGIAGVIAARDALGLKTNIVGVVASNAPCAKLSFEAGKPVETNTAATIADGLAVRVPVPEAIEIIRNGAERVVDVGEDEIAEAVRAYFTDTHNLAEGAGAAPLAALMRERGKMQGKKVALILSGGNIDRPKYLEILGGNTPDV